MVVNLLACPGIDCGIVLLTFRKGRSLPVCETLVLGDAFIEYDTEDALQAVVGYIEILDVRLQFHKALRTESAQLMQLMKIILERQPYFLHAAIGQKFEKAVYRADLLETEEETLVATRDLGQRHIIMTELLE